VVCFSAAADRGSFTLYSVYQIYFFVPIPLLRLAAARGQIAGTSQNPKKSKKNWKKLKVVDTICFD
jgi:hypothetical protein